MQTVSDLLFMYASFLLTRNVYIKIKIVRLLSDKKPNSRFLDGGETTALRRDNSTVVIERAVI